MPPFLSGQLLIDGLLSILAFAFCGWDKAAARSGRRRIPESRLLLVALLGGWPGALLAQSVFRHKTAKPSFRRAFSFVVAANLAATSAIVALGSHAST